MLGTIGEQIKAGIAGAFAEIKALLPGGNPTSSAAAQPAAGAITEEIRAEIKALLEPVTKELNQVRADLVKAQGDLTAANNTIKERDGAITQLQKEKRELEARLKDPKGEAGKQSAQILAGLHVQPVKTGADAGAGAQQETPEVLREQYQAIADYKERGAFYLKHRDKLLRAPAGKLTAAK